ncbi:MAG: hypothetical protein WCE44_08410 [Candidatus Velthaea sp.]
MITADLLRELPLFAPFTDGECEEIAHKAADLRVLPGEYLVQEGEEPSFYQECGAVLHP